MWHRVGTLVMRHLYLYRRSPSRLTEVFFWPVMELLLWGFLTVYLQRSKVPASIAFLIGAAIFWDILYRSQQAITLSVTEEIWVRNLLNLFIAPVRTFEIMLATCLVGILKSLFIASVLTAIAWFLYAFNLLAVGPALVPFLASLLLFGWAVGMCTMGLVLRFGQAAEALIWGVPFLLQPVSAVFYPVDVLPRWLQAVAWLLPSTYVFEGLRSAIRTGRVDPSFLAISLGMNLVYLALGAAFFGWMLAKVREKGYLSRLGME
ncbi:MAG TPA: ABC transporter permease [Thermoanaerobaculia bacterium]|jgi:ABC-2 type transport system permease protein